MDNKYSSIHYDQYLQLDKVLNAQDLRSEKIAQPAHDEMLFIIAHQVYELWFKEIIHEIYSVEKIFANNHVKEKQIGIAVSRLQRIVEIQKILIDQIKILETMTPLDFLDFRNYLLPASGFQSYQFRLIETLLGLKKENRMTYGNKEYSSVFTEEQQSELNKLEVGKSLFELIETWLERLPFLNFEDFNFLKKYEEAVKQMLEREKKAINETNIISEKEKSIRLQMLRDTSNYFISVFDKKRHHELVKNGENKLSHKATVSALFISLYRDEPILRMPNLVLRKLVEIDEQFTTWRYRHAQMVLRMLGKKIGTGGSSGHDYLKAATEKHKIFASFYNIATLLIPRSELPILPDNLKDAMSYYFTMKNKTVSKE